MKCKRVKKDGEQCKNHAMKGMEVCRKHGGKSLRGKEHPNYKHGRDVKHEYMPLQWAEHVKDAENDPTIKDGTRNIYLIEAIIRERMKGLQGEDERANWFAAKHLMDTYHRQISISVPKAAMALDALTALIDEGVNESVIEGEIVNLADEQRKHVDSYHKRMVDKHLVATADDIKYFVGVVMNSVLDNVPDENIRKTIADDILRAIPHPTRVGELGNGDNA